MGSNPQLQKKVKIQKGFTKAKTGTWGNGAETQGG